MLRLLPGISSSLPVHLPSFPPKTIQIAFPVLVVASTGPWVGPQNKTGRPTRFHRRLIHVPVLSAPKHVLLCTGIIIVSLR